MFLKLRTQLLLVSLSLLVLPWAVFLFVAELDRNLRGSQLSSLQAAANSIADSLQGEPLFVSRVRPESKTLLAGVLDSPVLLDGYAHDWTTFELTRRDFIYANNKVSVEQEDLAAASKLSIHAAVRSGRLYLFLRVTDNRLLYHQPNQHLSSQLRLSNGDAVIIRVLADDGTIRRYTFRWEAPGRALGRYYGKVFEGERPILTGNEYIASMVETGSGYDVEMRMPLPRNNVFGLSVIDRDARSGVTRWTGMFNPDELDDTGQLKVVDAELSDRLSVFTQSGMRVRVFDGQGWLSADADRRAPDASVREFEPEDANVFDALVYRFISWSLAKNVNAGRLSEVDDGKLTATEFELFEKLASDGPAFFRDKYNRVFLTALQKVTVADDLHGYVLIQQPRAALSAFTESAMLRLVKIFGLAVLFVAAVLLSYATLLSWRIRQLRNIVEGVVSRDGKITGTMPPSTTGDEIGDLSRSFHGIINRLGNYTGYLQSLGSKLSHELRTPLSVVTTSLENIDKKQLSDNTVVSVERAQQGAGRLQQLIRSLSEASSLEQTIEMSERQTVDLREWVEVSTEVYGSTYPKRRFQSDVQVSTDASVYASLELLHQMLDKLISNAVDFSAEGSIIYIGLYRRREQLVMFVENQGVPLAAGVKDNLFEPMVSEREHRDDQPHMGLGLYIVRLIAQFHGASVEALNLQPDAVRFEVAFPQSA